MDPTPPPSPAVVQSAFSHRLQALQITSLTLSDEQPLELGPTAAIVIAKGASGRGHGLASPPCTPAKVRHQADDPATSFRSSRALSDDQTLQIDLSQGELIGTGAWSKVYKLRGTRDFTPPSHADLLTPPATPEKAQAPGPPQILAVKVASRPDAREIFQEEAAILTHLQSHKDAAQHVIPFLGFALDKSALVLQYASSGTLESFTASLNTKPSDRRQTQLLQIFPRLASQLIAGLAFIHAAGVVHADIKPVNILLDHDDSEYASNSSAHLLRASGSSGGGRLVVRYCDFSSSFRPAVSGPSSSGATYEYMAPEQLSSNKALNSPCYAADVWSLGVSLLYVVAGDSPFVALQNNVFLLREAIKQGQPMQFARGEPVSERRIQGFDEGGDADGGLLDVVRVALRKVPGDRVTAAAWVDFVAKPRMAAPAA